MGTEFEYAEKMVYATDNNVKAGFDVVRLSDAIYKTMVENLFDQDFAGIATAAQAKAQPHLRPYLDRFRSQTSKGPAGPLLEQLSATKANEMLATFEKKDMTGICNAWATMWIWNAYDNLDTIEDRPGKLLCKAFQKYFQTTTAINLVKGRQGPEELADAKFMAKLKDYTGTFGLRVRQGAGCKGNFPAMRSDQYHSQFLSLATSIRDAVCGNPGVGFKLTISLSKSAHAIGLFARSPQALYIFDPNYGLYRYKDPALLLSDVYGLFNGTQQIYDFRPFSEWTLRGLEKLT